MDNGERKINSQNKKLLSNVEGKAGKVAKGKICIHNYKNCQG